MRVSWSAAVCVLVAGALNVALAQKPSGAADDPLPPLVDYQVRSYSAAEGLNAATFVAMEQTPDGFLYVGTGKGLFRFNSREFEPVALPGFGSTLIEGLFLDGRGRLWIRSPAMDVAYIESGTVHVLGRLATYFDGFWSTPDGTVWLTGTQGLIRITVGEREWFKVFTRADGLPSDTVAAVVQMPTGELIVPTASGLARLVVDPRAKRGLRFETFWSAPGNLTTSSYVRHDAKGLWIEYLSPQRTIRYHDGIVDDVGAQRLSVNDLSWKGGDPSIVVTNFATFFQDTDGWARASKIGPGGEVGRILLQRDGTRWIDLRHTSRHSELLRLRPGATEPELIDLSGRPEWSVITAMVEDHEGSIWISTDRGLLQLAKRRARAVAQEEGLPRELVLPVLQTHDGSVWTGTWGDGAFRFAHGGLAERWTAARGLPDDRVRSLFEDSNGDLWVGMRTAAARISHDRVVQRILVHNEVRGFAETRDHTLWIGGAQELVTRKPNGQVSRLETGPSIGATWAIFAEPAGSVLLGTQHGLFRVTPDLSAPTRVAAGQGLDGVYVTGILADSDGTLWVGTYDRSVYRLRPTGVDHIDQTVGFPSSAVYLLDDGHGGIWVSGYDGLWRISKDSLHAVADDIAHGRPRHLTLRPVPFGESEGAAGPEGNRASPGGWHLRDGRLIFNGSRGLTVVDPADTSASRISPRTIVLSVAGDGQRVALNGAATLPPQTRRVDIDFATLSFIAPHQHRFQYRLDGYDADWTETGASARTAYTNLRPGRYTFRVRSVRPPGTAWLGSEATQVIELQASWWQTRAFQLALLIALCAAVYSLHRLRLRQALAIHRVRATIASDMHDELGSSISSIALMTQMLESDAELDGSARQLLSRIQRATEDTALSVRHLVWLVDPAHSDIEFLLLRFRRVAGDLLSAIDVEFDIATSLASRRVSMSAMRNVLLIFKEALNNIARHARATRVEIRVTEQRGALAITIRDDGVGFDADGTEYGNGLENMRRRTQELGGALVVDTAPGQGTTIVVTVKLS